MADQNQEIKKYVRKWVLASVFASMGLNMAYTAFSGSFYYGKWREALGIEKKCSACNFAAEEMMRESADQKIESEIEKYAREGIDAF